MNDVGIDIKEALIEVGTPVIFTFQDTQYIEYIKPKVNKQLTDPFSREFFVDGAFPFDTLVDSGTVVKLEAEEIQDDIFYLVMSKTPEIFESHVVRYNSVLYKCNITEGKIERISGESFNTQYKKIANFVVIDEDCKGLYVNKVLDILRESDAAVFNLSRDEVFMSGNSDIRLFDRFHVASGEYYMVSNITEKRFKNVKVCKLTVDNR